MIRRFVIICFLISTVAIPDAFAVGLAKCMDCQPNKDSRENGGYHRNNSGHVKGRIEPVKQGYQ